MITSHKQVWPIIDHIEAAKQPLIDNCNGPGG